MQHVELATPCCNLAHGDSGFPTGKHVTLFYSTSRSASGGIGDAEHFCCASHFRLSSFIIYEAIEACHLFQSRSLKHSALRVRLPFGTSFIGRPIISFWLAMALLPVGDRILF